MLGKKIHPIDLHVGQRLKQAREFRGYTQTQLGTKVGLTLQQIQRHEKGASAINASRLWQYKQVLGVKLSFFFEGLSPDEGKNPPQPSPAAMRAAHNIDKLGATMRNKVISLVTALSDSQNNDPNQTD